MKPIFKEIWNVSGFYVPRKVSVLKFSVQQSNSTTNTRNDVENLPVERLTLCLKAEACLLIQQEILMQYFHQFVTKPRLFTLMSIDWKISRKFLKTLSWTCRVVKIDLNNTINNEEETNMTELLTWFKINQKFYHSKSFLFFILH